MHVYTMKGGGLMVVGVLGVDHDLIGRAIFWPWLGFSGGCWLRRPVGIHTELLGQMHVASFWRHLVWAAQPGQTLVPSHVNDSLWCRGSRGDAKVALFVSAEHKLP